MDYKLYLIGKIVKLDEKITSFQNLIEGQRSDIDLLTEKKDQLELKLKQSTSFDEKKRFNSYIQRTINSISSSEKLIQEFQNELARLSDEATIAKETLAQFAQNEIETQALLDELKTLENE